MTETRNTGELLDALAKVLLRCTVMGLLLVLIWFGVHALAGERIYSVVSGLFGLTRHEMDLIDYCGIVWVKCCTLLFFLIPYLAIRMVGRRRA